MRYTFLNPNGYTSYLDNERTDKLGKPIYRVEIHLPDGLMIYDSERNLTFVLHSRYSDLASIPKAIQIIKGFENWRWRRSAIAHDEVYRHGYLSTLRGECVFFSRCDADDMLASLILCEGKLLQKRMLSYVCSPIYWVGVQLFGWMSFMKKEKIT